MKNKPTDKEIVRDFTRGVLDRIRDFMRDNFPKEMNEYDSVKAEITGRSLKNGERGIYVREIKK